jgi:uncharacterized membrane protein
MVHIEGDYVLIGAQAFSVRKRFLEFRWEARAGPILFINVGDKKLGLAFFCHRRPDRSFTILGYKSPLCSRCTGLLLGFFGFIWLGLFQVHIPAMAVILLMVPTVIDGVSQLAGFRESNNLTRLLTGFMFTFGFISMLVK